MSDVLENVYGSLLVVRPPVPATLNKGGANYKSEVTHLTYLPRAAYDEWLAICEGILAFGGDAIFDFEEEDERLLDRGDLRVEADGTLRDGKGEALGIVDDVLTGRVFAANGPWVTVRDGKLRAVLPNMLTHRVEELPYYRRLLERIAGEGGYQLEVVENPHRWEGMADVAVVGNRAVLTYTVKGHYDAASGPKTMRSTREGLDFAADFAGVPASARVYAELVYPHFHGDTVHFGARPKGGGARLVQYPGGLWGDGAAVVAEALGEGAIVPITRDDAVEQYAGNSRQVEGGVLVPGGVSDDFVKALEGLGLPSRRIALYELFGKAGGGPACATLYLPKNLALPEGSRLRYSMRREEARARRERLPEKLEVDPGFFAGRVRG
ncbi:MAG TPA: hypothetical protein VN033_13520 [Vulgatibacter sp.]|nr:hypothetical protein [Vulgatibacter sp.]